MAAIHDLITQVDDEALRTRLSQELDRLTRERQFGLVFEQHLPELTPIFSAPIVRHALVARRDGLLTDVYRVRSVTKTSAHCVNRSTSEALEIPLRDLVVVRQFGEPIFPSLVAIDDASPRSKDGPWHTLIEADNYHALQLLQYTCAGQVDCIYIDPPYNTGERDWKYNNDYVDSNDTWAHSKWLAMMHRRLSLAKRLLNPATGVLIVTIDEHEVHHLGMLIAQIFKGADQQMVTIVTNQKGVSQGRLARTDEYAIFVFMPGASLAAHHDDLLSPDQSGLKRFRTPRWEWLLRGGNNSRREDREKLFYPIHVDPTSRRIVDVGEPLPLSKQPDLAKASHKTVAWPIRKDGSFGNWQLKPATLRQLVELGFVKLGGFHEKRKTWTVLYLNKGTQKRISLGEINIVDRDPTTGAVEIEYANQEARRRNIKTVWHRTLHDAGIYGSTLLSQILGEKARFSFPKSLYAVRDAIGAVVRNRPDALVIDFFAGSGTTLHAVQLLNAADGGHRRCILVTNNELSESEATELHAKGLRPGDPQWEQYGICRSITWPRSKFATVGKRDDGTLLEGDYMTGRRIHTETPITVAQLGFAEGKTLTANQRHELLTVLISPRPPLPDASPWFLDGESPRSLLWDVAKADEWIQELLEADHVTDLYVVTRDSRSFKQIRKNVLETIPPRQTERDERRPRNEGFSCSVQYFRLDFLDKDQVALKRTFAEILPILWLRAGAYGPPPKPPRRDGQIPWLVPKHNRFAVLLREHRFGAFLTEIESRPDLTHVFLVTDSEDAFQEMAAQIPRAECIQLYRDYLENFMVNRVGAL